MTVLCDHQTGYLPWLGVFHRVSLCDIYVTLDTVKFKRQSFDDRNKIRTPEGSMWLRVPTKKNKESNLLMHTQINHDLPWIQDHLKSIESAYGKCRYFGEYFPLIQEVLERKHDILIDLNHDLFCLFLKLLEIDVKVYKASNLEIEGSGNDYLINLCKHFGADSYIFGQGGKRYVEEDAWKNAEIKVHHQEYHHPTYPQRFGEFLPNLSIIDLLFNVGAKKAKDIINTGNIGKEELLRMMA